MRTTLVVPGLARGGPMVTSEARCEVRVLKKFFTRAFVHSFACDVERRGDESESDGCSYIITR